MDRSNVSQHQPGMVLFRKIPDQTRVIRVLRTLGKVSANFTGVVNLVSFKSSDVSSNAEWSNIAQEFQAYRVRRIVTNFINTYSASSAITGANDYPQGAVLCGLWWDRVPTSLSNIVQTDGMRILKTQASHKVENNFLGFPDAKLFTPTNATISTEAVYGISLQSSTDMSTLEPSSDVFSYVCEYDVEFQGMQ